MASRLEICREGGDRKTKGLSCQFLVYLHSELTRLPTAASTFGNMSRHWLLHSCASHRGDVSSALLQTSGSEKHQQLSIKVPTEIGHLFPDSEGDPARHACLMKYFSRTHFGAWNVVGGHHEETLKTGLEGHVDRSMFVVPMC